MVDSIPETKVACQIGTTSNGMYLYLDPKMQVIEIAPGSKLEQLRQAYHFDNEWQAEQAYRAYKAGYLAAVSAMLERNKLIGSWG